MATSTSSTSSTPGKSRHAKPHPWVDAPSAAALKKAFSSFPAPLASLCMKVHALVVETLPDVAVTLDLKTGSVGYGAHQYGANGWGIGALVGYSKWISLGFMKGATLPDPERLLEGTGKGVRHVKLRDDADLAEKENGLRGLVAAAAGRGASYKRAGRSARRTEASTGSSEVDAWLGRLPPEQRAALEKLRREIERAAPGGEPCISYGVPGWRVNGKLLVSYGAGKHHCAFYPGAGPIETHAAELAKYETSKGTLRFPPERPLPAALVRKLVKTRLAERAGS